MATPEFIVRLRGHVGHDLLWLIGITAVVMREEQVLLVRRSDNGWWTPVGGIVEPGEEPWVSAQREVLEEAGVACAVQGLARVGVNPPSAYANGDRVQFLDHTLACRWVEGEPYAADEESTEAGFFSLDKLPEIPEHLHRRIAVARAFTGSTRLG